MRRLVAMCCVPWWLLGSAAGYAAPLVSATPQPGAVHVVLDICPDWIEFARANVVGAPEVHYQTDDFWISTADVWLFHGSMTGSLHHFDVSATVIGISPDQPSENGLRGYGVTTYHGSASSYEYQLLPVVNYGAVPEPGTLGMAMVALSFFRARGRRSFSTPRASRYAAPFHDSKPARPYGWARLPL